MKRLDRPQYLLDTNIIIEFNLHNQKVIDKLLEVGLENCFMSIVSWYELYDGAYNIKNEKYFNQEIARLEMLRTRIKIVPLPLEASLFASEKHRLIRAGMTTDDNDVLIAATAIAESMIMVTDNIRHFSRIQGIKLENWIR